MFLKLQPYVQSFVVHRAHHKLAFRYYGPYPITAKIGSVAYRMALPAASKIHPVFHVSQLKKFVAPHQQVLSKLPVPNSLLLVPMQILQCRVRQEGKRTIAQGLIQWNDGAPDAATWEDLESLKQKFPRAPAWGQAASQGRGGVNSSPSTTTDDMAGTGLENQEEALGPTGEVSFRPMRDCRHPKWLAGHEWAH